MELQWLSFFLVITIMVSNSQTQSYYNLHPGVTSYNRAYPYVAPYQVPGVNRGHHVQFPLFSVLPQVPFVGKPGYSSYTGLKTNVDDHDPSKVDQTYKSLRQKQQENAIKVKTVMSTLKTALTPLITLLQDVGDDNDDDNDDDDNKCPMYTENRSQ